MRTRSGTDTEVEMEAVQGRRLLDEGRVSGESLDLCDQKPEGGVADLPGLTLSRHRYDDRHASSIGQPAFARDRICRDSVLVGDSLILAG